MAAEALARVKASVDILADIDVKHSLPTVPNYTAEWEIAECAARKGRLPIKAIIITGKRTGEPPEPDYVAKLAHTAHRLGLKALVGSGVSPELIRLPRDAVDGFIVGSYVKAEGRTEAPVSRERATELARAVR